jgi:ferric-dicitrate binding protein FerR (iron transport regulator)
MSHPVDDSLLDRYAAGECPASERIYVERMVATDAVWARRLEQIRTLRSMVQRMPQQWDVDRLWSGMQERRAATTLTAATSPSADTSRLPQPGRRAASARVTGAIAPVTRGRWTTLTRIAAVVAITAGVSALWYATQGERGVRVAHYQIEAQSGRVTSARLADGSRVTLAAGSVLDVPREFGRERDVTLIGQAYFEIAHDSTRPFRVHTRGALTRVLGTRFDVRAYPEDSNVTVLVTEGRVEFGPDEGERALSGATAASGAGPAVMLTRGDRARLESDGKLRVEHGVAVDRELAWLRGRLVFVDEPLSAVALEVERWYGVHVIVEDTSLASAPVTATFGNEPVDGILRTLAISLDARLKRSGDTAWLGTPR